MKSLIRTATTSYSYIESDFEGTPEETIEFAKKLLSLWNSPERDSSLPTALGQTMKDKWGHLYESAQNNAGEFYWLFKTK